MSKEMINDMTAGKKSIDGLNRHVCIFNGYDTPRYILPDLDQAGELGVLDWGGVWTAPQQTATPAGSLTVENYYSIIVVPVNTDISVAGTPLYGGASKEAIPVTGSNGYTFSIPTDQANTATGVTSNISVESGVKYQILSKFCTQRLIYSAEGSDAESCLAGPYYLAGVVEDMSTATYDLLNHSPAADVWDSNYFQPPTAKTCREVRGVLFAGGGIEETRGKARVDNTTESSVTSTLANTGTVGSKNGTVAMIEDSSKTGGSAWTDDQFVGHTLLNDDNDESVITANSTDGKVYPGDAAGNKFRLNDSFYILDKTGTPAETNSVDFSPSATQITCVDTVSAPDKSLLVVATGTNTIAAGDTSGAPSNTGTVDGRTDDTLAYVDPETTPDETTFVTAIDGDVVGVCDTSGTAQASGDVQGVTTNTITSVDLNGTPESTAVVTSATANTISASVIGSSLEYEGAPHQILGNYAVYCDTSVPASASAYLRYAPVGSSIKYFSASNSPEYSSECSEKTQGSGFVRVFVSDYNSASSQYDGGTLFFTTFTGEQHFLGHIIEAGSYYFDVDIDIEHVNVGYDLVAYKPAADLAGDHVAFKDDATYVGVTNISNGMSSVYFWLGASDGSSLSFYSPQFAEDEYNGTIITDEDNNYLTFVSDTYGTYLQVADGSALTVGESTKLYAPDDAGFSIDYTGYVLYSGGALVGVVESNTAGALTVTDHGLSEGATIVLYDGDWTANEHQWKAVTNASGVPVGIITENTKHTLTVASHGLAVDAGFKIYPSNEAWTADEFKDFAAYGDGSFAGTILGNGTDTLTISGHSLSIGDEVDIFEGNWSAGALEGKILTGSDGVPVGIVESNTKYELTVTAHGLAIDVAFKLYSLTESWQVDQWKGYALYSDGSSIGIIESNTSSVLTVTAHGLSVGDEIDFYEGEWTEGALVNSFVLSTTNAVLGRVTANSTSTLTLNATHGLSDGTSFEIHTPEVGTVTTPTGFVTAGGSWTPNEYNGEVIVFSALGSKTIFRNAVNSASLVDEAIPAAGETYSIKISSFIVSEAYSFPNENGVAVKVARYEVPSEEPTARAIPVDVYKGDTVTVTGSADPENGNDVTDVEVLRADPQGKWFEIENENLVEVELLAGATIKFTRKHITGNTSGDDQTYFTRGLVGGRFNLNTDDILEPWVITWVDEVHQTLGFDEPYVGSYAGVLQEFSAKTNWGLYYSDPNNPHRWRAENLTEIPDDIVGIRGLGDWVLVFCKYSIWKLPYNEMGRQPEMVSENVRCPSDAAIVATSNGIAFYDGDGFSVTDGFQVKSLTADRARDYMATINKEYEEQIVGLFNPKMQRFEFYFPTGENETNNDGLFIEEGTWNCYPVQYQGVNSAWVEYSAGVPAVFYGTDETDSGEGIVFRAEELDGTGEEMVLASVDYTAKTLIGSPCSIFPGIKEIALMSAETGEITKHFAKYNSFFFTGGNNQGLEGVAWEDSGATENGEIVYHDSTGNYAYWNDGSAWLISAVADVGGSPVDYFKAIG